LRSGSRTLKVSKARRLFCQCAAVNLGQAADSVSIGTGLWNPLGRSSSTARSFYVCHFQGNYKENERVGQASQLSAQFQPFVPSSVYTQLFLQPSPLPPATSTSPKDKLIFSLYSISLFKFDNPSPQGPY